MRRFFCALFCAFFVTASAHAGDADTQALTEIASALIQKDAKGVAYGTRYYQSLPVAADGKRLIRIYTKPYPRVAQLINANLWYQLTEPAPLREPMVRWVLEVYSREFPELAFEVTEDPTNASMFMVEAKFAPSDAPSKRRAPDTYIKTAANSMNASINGKPAAIINFNSLGNPWFERAITAGQGAVVRATILNEFFNGFAVSDFQDLKRGALSQPTQQWLAQHQSRIDDFTITRSGGPREDEQLKALDKQIVLQLSR